jgi:hypothetical protein
MFYTLSPHVTVANDFPMKIAIRAKVQKIKAQEQDRRTKAKAARERGFGPMDVDSEGGQKRKSALDRFARKKD